MLINFGVRAETRALVSAVLFGSALGLLLGGSYLAGGAARAAAAHARTARLASAAASGFSETALKAEVEAMSPGVRSIARRHDPFTAAGAAERDRETDLLAARLVRTDSAAAASPSRPPVLRASYSSPAVPARPFRLVIDNPLAGARELDCLSQAVYYEARGESSQGQAAVAQVVLNRTRHPGYPRSVCGVVYQGAQQQTCQFSFACDGSARRPREMSAWKRAQGVAARALGGFVLADVGDATHFHVARLGGIWGAGLVQVAQIGTHVFYRLTGHPGAGLHAAPDLYVPASELAEQPVYAEAKAASTPADGAGSSLILAAAMSAPPQPQSSALRGATEPAPVAAPAKTAPTKATSAEKTEKPATVEGAAAAVKSVG